MRVSEEEPWDWGCVNTQTEAGHHVGLADWCPQVVVLGGREDFQGIGWSLGEHIRQLPISSAFLHKQHKGTFQVYLNLTVLEYLRGKMAHHKSDTI